MLARHVDVRQEAHLQLLHAVAAAHLAAPALHVERKASGLVAARLGRLRLRKKLADFREEADIRRGIRPRRTADRRLVNLDDLVEVFHARQLPILSGNVLRAVEVLHQRPLERLVDERRLARAGNARHDGEAADGDVDGHVLQIVLGRSGKRQESLAARTARRAVTTRRNR